MIKRENPLTPEQQATVQSHLYLVDAIVRTKIQTNESIVGLAYEDVRQEGYLLLCSAVQTYDSDRAKLSTYATKVIYNGLISHCRRINWQESHTSTLSLTECPEQPDPKQGSLISQKLANSELKNLLDTYAQQYSGITQLGIEALLMNANGICITEIARLYQVKPSHIGAWISRAKQKLRTNERFLEDIA